MIHHLLVAVLLAASPMPAGAAAPQVAAPYQRVVIPFNPPLDRVLRYRITQGATSEAASLVMNVRFSLSADGYHLTATYDLPTETTANPRLALLSRPLVLEMNREGDFIGIADEAAWLRDSEAVVAGMAGNIADAGAMRRMAETIRALPPEGRLAIFARNQQPITEFAGTEMSVGETLEGSMPAGGPLGVIDQDFSARLESVTPGRANFKTVHRIPPEQFAQMLETLREYNPNGPPSAAFPHLRGERVGLYEIDTESGLATRYALSIKISGLPEGDISREMTTLERISD